MITTDLMINSLDELDGPVEGILVVSNNVCWQPNKGFNLSDDSMAAFVYSEIIENAVEISDLKKINKDKLIALWSKLHKDYRTKARWESKFPELKG